MHLKSLALRLGATALSIVVIFFLVSRFAPASVKSFFTVA